MHVRGTNYAYALIIMIIITRMFIIKCLLQQHREIYLILESEILYILFVSSMISYLYQLVNATTNEIEK